MYPRPFWKSFRRGLVCCGVVAIAAGVLQRPAAADDVSGIIVLIDDGRGRQVPGLRFEHGATSCGKLLDTARSATSAGRKVSVTFSDCYLGNGIVEGNLVIAACFPVKTPVNLDMVYPLSPTPADEQRLRDLWDRVRVVFDRENWFESSQCN